MILFSGYECHSHPIIISKVSKFYAAMSEKSNSEFLVLSEKLITTSNPG